MKLCIVGFLFIGIQIRTCLGSEQTKFTKGILNSFSKINFHKSGSADLNFDGTADIKWIVENKKVTSLKFDHNFDNIFDFETYLEKGINYFRFDHNFDGKKDYWGQIYRTKDNSILIEIKVDLNADGKVDLEYVKEYFPNKNLSILKKKREGQFFVEKTGAILKPQAEINYIDSDTTYTFDESGLITLISPDGGMYGLDGMPSLKIDDEGNLIVGEWNLRYAPHAKTVTEDGTIFIQDKFGRGFNIQDLRQMFRGEKIFPEALGQKIDLVVNQCHSSNVDNQALDRVQKVVEEIQDILLNDYGQFFVASQDVETTKWGISIDRQSCSGQIEAIKSSLDEGFQTGIQCLSNGGRQDIVRDLLIMMVKNPLIRCYPVPDQTAVFLFLHTHDGEEPTWQNAAIAKATGGDRENLLQPLYLHLSPRYFSDDRGAKDRAQTLFHESLHNSGYEHDLIGPCETHCFGFGRTIAENEAQERYENCMGCLDDVQRCGHLRP